MFIFIVGNNFKVLNKNFKNYIIKLVKVAFFGCISFANINGHLSSPIHIFRGLHQGSPLSPIIFILVAQVGSCRLDSRQGISALVVLGCKESISFSAFLLKTQISLRRYRSNVLKLLYRSYPNSVCTQVVKPMYLRLAAFLSVGLGIIL